MTRTVVEVRDLVKRYQRGVVALDGISFQASAGEVFGLLGPNGAGKTTTVGILTTRVRPTSGAAFVDGVDVVRFPVAARSRLAVVPQRSNLDRAISIRDNLLFHAAYHGVPAHERDARASALLQQFQLHQRAGSKPDMFSGGQSQRVMIARALMHEPVVLFLDEPTTGLDPAARLFVWDRLRELKERGVTLVLTTHDMHEASALADRVAIIDRGKLLALDAPAALVQSLPGRATLELAIASENGADGEAVRGVLQSLPGVEALEPVQAEGGELRMRLYTSADAPLLVAPAAAALGERGLSISDIKLGSPSLEDVFIHLTGRTLR
ncbi:MAG: ABC transporter ATP-binding protein [Candidatus Dormibacteraeota bacterium]|nr:ABC transporter ATP-binding protein [Candidatus Dormibacteraeota bacterium]